MWDDKVDNCCLDLVSQEWERRLVTEFETTLSSVPALPVPVISNSQLLLSLLYWDGQEFLEKGTDPFSLVQSPLTPSSFSSSLLPHSWPPAFLNADPTLSLFTLSAGPATPRRRSRSLTLSQAPLSPSSFCTWTCSFLPHFSFRLQMIFWETFIYTVQAIILPSGRIQEKLIINRQASKWICEYTSGDDYKLQQESQMKRIRSKKRN